jgi:hypothetical protein
MVELTTLLSAIQAQPNAFHGLTLTHLMKFVVYVGKLKDNILLVQTAEHLLSVPPAILPQSVAIFLRKACGIARSEQIECCWDLLKDMIWNQELVISVEKEGTAFAEHGQGLGISTIIPCVLFLCNLIDDWTQPHTPFICLNILVSKLIALGTNGKLC